MNGAGIVALGEGLRYVEERGIDSIRAHELSLIRRLAGGLQSIPKVRLYGPKATEPRASVLTLNVDGHQPDEVAGILDASFGIAVRAGLQCAPGAHREIGTFPAGAVRVSPGPFSTADEIDQLVAAMGKIAG